MGSQYGIRVNGIAPGPIERTGGAEKLWESNEAAKRTLNRFLWVVLGSRKRLQNWRHSLCQIRHPT